ncbi:hypothetical protein J6590_002823 [Homalodisca vitripennis]|nr:hypothetical protein J6590_002823 [Homalodisca vitripennis]
MEECAGCPERRQLLEPGTRAPALRTPVLQGNAAIMHGRRTGIAGCNSDSERRERVQARWGEGSQSQMPTIDTRTREIRNSVYIITPSPCINTPPTILGISVMRGIQNDTILMEEKYTTKQKY